MGKIKKPKVEKKVKKCPSYEVALGCVFESKAFFRFIDKIRVLQNKGSETWHANTTKIAVVEGLIAAEDELEMMAVDAGTRRPKQREVLTAERLNL